MRQTVSEANKYLRQTVKSVEAGGVATLAQAMEHPGTLQEVHVTTLDAADAEIPAAAGFSEGVKLPTRIETKKLVIVGKFPIATQAEYDALSDVMKDKAVILNVTECPIGSEVKAIECNTLGVPVDAHMWIMGADGWKGGSSSTLSPDGSTSLAGPLRVEGDVVAGAASFAGPVAASNLGKSLPERGVLAAIGTSTIGNATTTLANGVTVFSYNSIWDRVNLALGSRYTVKNYGYNGQDNAVLMARLEDTVLPTRPAIVVLHFSANDLEANDLASAETAFATVKEATELCRQAGAVPIIVTPHLQIDVAGKWGPTVAYDTRCQEWGLVNDVMVVSAAYAMCANTDKTGTAKTDAMGDTLHANALGIGYIVDEALAVMRGEIAWRMLSGGNVEWTGQLHNNPRCTGSGAASGTGISGTRCANISPARFSGAATCVCSVGSDTEGAYMDLEVTFGSAADAIQVPEIITLARHLDGKSYVGMCDIELVSGLFVRDIVLSNAFASGNIQVPNGTMPVRALPLGRYVRRTPRYTKAQTAPAADTTNRVIIYGNAAGTSVLRVRVLGTRETETP